MLKHDGEPIMIELAGQVQKQAGEKGVSVTLHQTPAYSLQWNGSCEKMDDIIQNQVRALKFDAEGRHGVSVSPALSIWAWLARHDALLVARYGMKGSDRTAFEDAFDTSSTSEVAGFAEVWWRGRTYPTAVLCRARAASIWPSL